MAAAAMNRVTGAGMSASSATPVAMTRSPAVVPLLSLMRRASRSLPIQGWVEYRRDG